MTDPGTVLTGTVEWPVDHLGAAVLNKGYSPTFFGDAARLFPLASVSKLITAYTVLIAVSEDCFGLDDTIAQIGRATGLPVDGPTDATVRELLSHASGIGFQDRGRQRPAQTRRIYSSAGFEILAELVSSSVREVDLDFASYAHAAIFEPLGIGLDEIVLEGSAGHGFRGSVAGLTKLAAEFLRPQLLPEQLWSEALRPQFPEINGIVPGYGLQRPCPWGLGIELHGVKEPHWLHQSMPADVAGHFGESGTFLWFHRDSDSAAVVLTDRPFGDWARQRWDIFNGQLWESLA